MASEMKKSPAKHGMLTRDSLYSLEQYAQARDEFRAEVMRHKRNRRLPLGNNATLYFEDRLTVQYQVQEMLRIERIFEAAGINEELQAYNPLIPDGSNWKATFMVEYSDPEERASMLRQLVGVENCVWLQIGESDKIRAIANEDIDRTRDSKTSAVHFLRFELASTEVQALQDGAELAAGIDHGHYDVMVRPVAANVRQSLLMDLG